MNRYRSGARGDGDEAGAGPRAPGRSSPSTAKYPSRATGPEARPPSSVRDRDLGAAPAGEERAEPADPFWFCADRAPMQPVQRMVMEPGVSAPPEIEAAAARGVATPSAALPHAETIARSFGRHDVSHVQAHTGAAASAAARDMGAAAFATGDHVVLADSSLHTVAHEAAHVVQQRAGVHCKTGDDDRGDTWERHADRVADAVVGGRSAEAVLDEVRPTGGATGVQRMKLDADGSYAMVSGDYNTENRAAFAAWVTRLEAANNVAVLRRLLASLHRDVFDMADHESIAKSLVQRALDKLAPAAAAPADPANPALANLPRADWWKLFIEGEKHDAGQTDDANAMRFDRDQSPGYYAAMSKAFATEVAGTDGHRLGFDDYNRMHVGVTQDILRSKDDGGFEPVPHKLSANDVQFPMTKGEFPNPVALAELRDEGMLGATKKIHDGMAPVMAGLSGAQRDGITAKREAITARHEAGIPTTTVGTGTDMLAMAGQIYEHQGDAADYSSSLSIANVQSTGAKQLLVNTNRDPDAARGEVDGLFATYYARLAQIDRAHGQELAKRRQKLKAVAKLVRALHVGHYFHDANGRLNTMVLLNRLLVDAGFTPVLMNRTDIFGGAYSADELATAIQRGIVAFAAEVQWAHLAFPALVADDDAADGVGVGPVPVVHDGGAVHDPVGLGVGQLD
jgi:hypothetical protein